MLAVVKTPLIDLRIEGEVPPRLLRLLKTEYGSVLKLAGDEHGTTVDFFKTNFYRDTKQQMTPGDYVKIYRENAAVTQAQLGEKVGASKSFICDIEHNRRAISKEMAKKLSSFFGISVERFI